jgi:uncharacterized protein YdiU (UPF0061 family)
MTRIKSSIELAMEKTAGFRLSQEEKEKLKEEEFQSKAQGLVNRFLEVDLNFRDIEKELSKYDSTQRTKIEKLMLRYLCDAIHLEKDNTLIFQGIEKLNPASQKLTAFLQELVSSYQRQKEKEFQKATSNVMNRLKKMGISGSAVVPKIEGSPEWEEIQKNFRPDFEKRLQSLLTELKN